MNKAFVDILIYLTIILYMYKAYTNQFHFVTSHHADWSNSFLQRINLTFNWFFLVVFIGALRWSALDMQFNFFHFYFFSSRFVIMYIFVQFTECQDGKYGDGCQMDCGRCRDFKHCHHVNGTCLSGCEQGYIGGKCICTY